MGKYGSVDIGDDCIALIAQGDGAIKVVRGHLVETRAITRMTPSGVVSFAEYHVEALFDGAVHRVVCPEVCSAEHEYGYQLHGAIQRLLGIEPKPRGSSSTSDEAPVVA